MKLASQAAAICLCGLAILWMLLAQAITNEGGAYGQWQLLRDFALTTMICVHIWRGRFE